MHRSWFTNIEEASDHCDICVPSKRQCVEFFSSSIKCNGPNLNQLHNSGIPNNAIFSKKAVNSSEKCILPQFTVNSNFGETCYDSNSQSSVLRTLYNDDLVPITVEDSGSDESYKTLNHESNFVQVLGNIIFQLIIWRHPKIYPKYIPRMLNSQLRVSCR